MQEGWPRQHQGPPLLEAKNSTSFLKSEVLANGDQESINDWPLPNCDDGITQSLPWLSDTLSEEGALHILDWERGGS